ncbi:DUF4127 family protein [bacterium]|nr:DUF4127 family protein [bacterium]
MRKIAVIPIDNRPVCYDLVKMTAALDLNNQIFLPPISMLGDLKSPADIDGILNFLENLQETDIIIISLDTIAYGGLIPSRRSNNSFEEIKSRIDKLFKILSDKKAKIYAFSSIMRISNNNINEEEKEYWNKYGKQIFEYSYNLHKSELTGETVSASIPNEILKDYLETRKRNFEINKYYIELKNKGLIDTLVFSKDDCAKFGINVKEAQELEKLAQNSKNIFIKTGADEIPLSLLSRAVNKEKNIKIAPVFLCPQSIQKISKYEDISVEASVKSQIELAGGIISNQKDCDLVLYINNFRNEQGELVMDIYEPPFSGKLELINKPCFFADILNANGSDNNFAKQILSLVNTDNFYGYAAWNTTGNTLGSAISAALTYFKAENKNKNAFIDLQIIRFLDDMAYQANVRKEIRSNPKNLSNNELKKQMQVFEPLIFYAFNKACTDVQYSFPWNRFFEIRIKL